MIDTGDEDLTMQPVIRHVSRSCVAGVVALLPVGGLVLTVVYMEKTLSESWLADQPYYFPGLGIVAAVAMVYLIGLTVTTFIGRWAWRVLDRTLDSLPALGQLYQTLKQLLGYGGGKEAMFQSVVLVRAAGLDGHELGLVTNEVNGSEGRRLVVFVPGAPNPATGRLLLLDPKEARTIDMSVNDAMKAIVSVGKRHEDGEGGGEER
jgi:uncharacterized membrane protein